MISEFVDDKNPVKTMNQPIYSVPGEAMIGRLAKTRFAESKFVESCIRFIYEGVDFTIICVYGNTFRDDQTIFTSVENNAQETIINDVRYCKVCDDLVQTNDDAICVHCTELTVTDRVIVKRLQHVFGDAAVVDKNKISVNLNWGFIKDDSSCNIFDIYKNLLGKFDIKINNVNFHRSILIARGFTLFDDANLDSQYQFDIELRTIKDFKMFVYEDRIQSNDLLGLFKLANNLKNRAFAVKIYNAIISTRDFKLTNEMLKINDLIRHCN